MTPSYVWHDSFMCVTWLINLCDMTHSCVWHDSFTHAWKSHKSNNASVQCCFASRDWVMSHKCMSHVTHMHETWMSHRDLCDMTQCHAYVWQPPDPIHSFCSLAVCGVWHTFHFGKYAYSSLRTNMHEPSGVSTNCTLGITQPGWVIDFHLINMIRRNFLYNLGTSTQRANRRGRPLRCFYMIHRVGLWLSVCSVLYCVVVESWHIYAWEVNESCHT